MAVGSYDEDGDRPGGRGVVGRLAFRGLGVRGVEERLLALSATRTFRSSWLVVRVMLLSLGAPAILVLSWKPFASAARGIESRFEGLTQRRFLAWVLGGALALRLAWISLIPIHLEADWLEYDGYALRLAQTGVFSVDGRPTTVRVPGYPALLAAVYKVCGHSPKAGVLVNILLGIAIVALSYLLVRRQWGEVRARWAAILLAVFPSQINFQAHLSSEPLFTALLLGSLVLLLGSGNRQTLTRALAAGLVLGLAAAGRPICLLLPFGLAVWMLLLDGPRRIFEGWRATLAGAAQCRTPGLAQLQRAVRVAMHEHALHRNLARAVAPDHLADLAVDRQQPPGQHAVADPDAATGDIAWSRRPGVDDAKASHARSRVETQDTHRRRIAVALQWLSA